MTGFLDIRTLFIIGALNAWVCSLMMAGSQRLHASSRRALMWGGVTTALVGVAMILIALRGHLPDVITVLAANALGSVAALGLYESMRLLCRGPARTRAIAVAAAMVVGAHLALGTGLEHHEVRLMITSVMQAVCAALAVPMLLARRGEDAPLPLNWAIIVMAAFAILNVVRFVTIARNGVTLGSDAMMIEPVQVVAITLYALAPMAFALSFIGIVNGRLAGELRRIAVTDSLTGLLTRRGFHEQAARMLARTDRQAGTIGVMLIDIDHFKAINDGHGHSTGDQVLKNFGRMLGELLPARAICGRYGGEEFCVMLECSDAEAARLLAESLRQRVRAAPVMEGADHIRLSISIGVATAPRDAGDLKQLLAIADRRAYLAKDAGRDCVVADDETPIGPTATELLPA